MGADTKALRTRIKSVDSTLHLTKAMGLVASSKIRGASDAMNKSRQYSSAVSSVVDLLVSSRECRKSPYVKGNSEGKDRIIVIAGDRGLAGGYNANVFRLAKEFEGAEFIPIGKRACERFGSGFISSEKFSVKDGAQLSNELCRDFVHGHFVRLGVIWTKYISVLTQETQISWILPLSVETKSANSGTIFEPDELTILNTAVPEYINGKLIGFVRESYASEVAARRMAMDSAGKNAQAMIEDLHLEYNRARQGAITQEITEIVAGSGT
ncbi:MAG: ATP synthase F1 subunit gamma [Acutalibacteraceae bacterium]|nr:ATP synthase F1 subunit gamma [Acutalibacteraceae bacterium]